MDSEQNKCDFCGEITTVSRQYVRVKNKHFDDNKQGKYSDFFYYCDKCGIEVSDGYHTFDELYEHRITLFIALCRRVWHSIPPIPTEKVWRSKRHSDGELCFGTGNQFVLGINKKTGEQITYHIPIECWNETDFAETLEEAPEWYGHTSADVLERLKNL